MKKILFIFLLLLLLDCAQPPLYKDKFVISSTFLEVISPYPDAAKIVYREFKRLDKIFNLYAPYSELSSLNRSYNKPVKVSKELIEVINLASQVYQLTGGYFDVSRGALYKFWKDVINNKKKEFFPSSQVIEEIKKIGGMEYILLDKEKGTITIKKKGLIIDLGGIAKGYMIDKAVKKLKDANIDSALINAGGDIYCLGKKEGGFWQVGIGDPLRKGELVYSLKLYNQAIATSGNYEQFFTYKGQTYSHLINPFSGFPQRGNILSVSVVAKNATTADSLATAFFIMGIDKLKEFLSKNLSTLKIFVITKDEKGEHLHIF
ncbi:MAG: FAD:protein FMN transferase [Candidatus Omnitrophota bacterium]|nr:MAG: FAD:protein FMN transferase [Candidatus Omnitrophota bacterium]